MTRSGLHVMREYFIMSQLFLKLCGEGAKIHKHFSLDVFFFLNMKMQNLWPVGV